MTMVVRKERFKVLQTRRPISSQIVSNITVPRFFCVKQNFKCNSIIPADIPRIIKQVLEQDMIGSTIRKGMKIAITVGSRGIANLPVLVKSIVDYVKSREGLPFVIPAMGSHGSATAEGQLSLLEAYGITEEYIGCPIISSMDVVCLGKTVDGKDVYIDKNAATSDGIIVFCRIKPHTAFRGDYESGIMKMMAIGLGKQKGAEACHESGFNALGRNIEEFGRIVLNHAPILFAVPIIENAFEETEQIYAIKADDIIVEEPKLLKEAYSLMPRLWEDNCDVLVVDSIGKNYSGDGMDPNITGTFSTPYATGGIKSQRVCILDLSDETHGNGVGIGMAHVTTQRAVNKLDLDSMYANVITSTVLGGVKIPLIMDSDRRAIQACIQTCSGIDKMNPKIIRIPNSMHISRIWLSEAFYEEVKSNPNYSIQSEPVFLNFNDDGDLW